MVNFKHAIKSCPQRDFVGKKEVNQVAKQLGEGNVKPKITTGQEIKITPEQWEKILKKNIKVFEAVLRGNPNDEIARSHLQNTKNLLLKLYDSKS